jgi:hypothetical protein
MSERTFREMFLDHLARHAATVTVVAVLGVIGLGVLYWQFGGPITRAIQTVSVSWGWTKDKAAQAKAGVERVGENLRQEAREIGTAAKEAGATIVDKTGDAVGAAREKISAAAETAREHAAPAIDDMKERGKARADELYERGKNAYNRSKSFSADQLGRLRKDKPDDQPQGD